MRTQYVPTWTANIFIGSCEGYDGPCFTEYRVLEAIAEYQRLAPEGERGCVRISECTYKFAAYEEAGWVISVLNYPRLPLSAANLERFARRLAEHLLVTLKQNRVSVEMPTETLLFESDGAEQAPVLPHCTPTTKNMV